MKRWLWLPIVALLIFSVSCGGRSREVEPETPDVESPVGEVEELAPVETEEPSPVEEPTAVEEPTPVGDPSVDSDAFEALDSYRARMNWRVVNPDGTVEESGFERAATRDPRAESISIISEDGTIDFIQIGNDTWMRFGEEWVQTTSESSEMGDFGDMLVSGDEWVTSASDYEFEGRERVNEIQTRHYRLEYEEALLGLLEMTDADEVEKGTADVWIADESNLPEFMVRFHLEMEGTSEEGTTKVTMTQDIYDVNEPFVIEPPAEVGGGVPEGVPIYPGATEVTRMAGMTMFTAPDDLATVQAFYEDALSAAGWTEGEGGFSAEDTVSLSYAKEGDTLTLMISANEDGTSSVMIMSESQPR